MAIVYLTKLPTVKPSRGIWHGDQGLLVVRTSHLAIYGDRPFSHTVPYMWNTLPSSLRLCQSISHVKSQLKSHLFRQTYPYD